MYSECSVYICRFVPEQAKTIVDSQTLAREWEATHRKVSIRRRIILKKGKVEFYKTSVEIRYKELYILFLSIEVHDIREHPCTVYRDDNLFAGPARCGLGGEQRISKNASH